MKLPLYARTAKDDCCIGCERCYSDYFEIEKLQLFKNCIESSSWIIGPDIFLSELTNTFWKYYRAGVINHEECVQYAEDGLNLVDDLIPGKYLWKESLTVSLLKSP